MRRLGPGLALVAALLLGATGAGVAATPTMTVSAPPAQFTTGISDGIYETPGDTNVWLRHTVAIGAQLVLLPVNWAGIAPSRPARDPASPGNPAYNWGTLDQTVRQATADHLTVAFTIAGAGGPAWADGPGRPRHVPAGTWQPNARAFGAFAEAVARRYSGSYDPGGGVLPRVRYYQAWSEPNLDDHLNPQWIRVHGHWQAESPIIYRGLLNAFYSGVTAVHASNVVITGGTGPFGDLPGGGRMTPVEFDRTLLCLDSQLRPQHCPHPAHFDVLAHHPYEIGGPYQRAFDVGDVTLPDLWKLTRVLRAAEGDGLVLPSGRKPVWVTEFNWTSKPPNSHGIPVIERGYWIEEAFHELWRQGVSAITWFLIQDEPSIAGFGTGGLYFTNGRVKPGIAGFLFPFLVVGSRHSSMLWGISPESGVVLVQARGGHGWRTLDRIPVTAHAIFTRPFSLSGGEHVRAVIGHLQSLVWPRT